MRPLVVGADFEAHIVRVEAFSKMRAILRPVRRWRSCPARLSARRRAREVHEIEELLPGEVGLLQKISSEQIRHGSILVYAGGPIAIETRHPCDGPEGRGARLLRP